jgi:von Willebrand factor type A C-terminal domain/von Willebrand factor type A domain
MSAPEFTVEVFQNEYLPDGAREVNAIVTVTCGGTGADAGVGRPAVADDAAEIIIVDCSGSMGAPRAKLDQARDATAAAIDAVRDGVGFAIIQGNHVARPLYPADGSLAIASQQSREAARKALGFLRAGGGTAIGQWLLLAHTTFKTRDSTLRHAILLTDGQNASESADALAAAIDKCEGVFSCDCRGVGTDWEVGELRNVASALLGTVDIVADPAGLAADFASMMQASMAKELADVALRVWTPQHTTVRFVKQVAPAVEDLTARRFDVTPQSGDYPTGSWGAESRDYHVCVEVVPAAVGDVMLAARVSLVQTTASGTDILGQGLVRAIWTTDEALSTRVNRHVGHFTGQAELAQLIQDGLEARRANDEELATAKLGRAVALAQESGNADTEALLARVVDVDPATGSVRLKRTVIDADEMALDTRSTKTVRVKKQPG